MLTAVLVGIAIGLVVGALGAGGGLLAIPALVYLLHLTPHNAAASSLVIVGVTALVSLIAPARAGMVRWKEGIAFGLLAVVGAVAGSRVSLLIPGHILMYMFGTVLLFLGTMMVRQGLRARTGPKTLPRKKAGIVQILLAATLTGIYTGLFGLGGGVIVIPLLVIMMGFRMQEASGTALVVLVISSISGLLARIGTESQVQWDVVLPFMIASMIASLIAGPIAQKAPGWVLTVLFGLLLLAVAVATLVATALQLS